ncbi:MAG: 3-oxoacyl-ACP synthase III family protein [Prevotella sp.]
MAFFNIPNVVIKGISACVPANVEAIKDYPLFSEIESDRMLPFFGLSKHHIADDNTCASDLCFVAAEKLLSGSGWDKNSIDCLIFVTEAPDYIFPATSCVLHNRLGLNRHCAAFDIPFGCSGWVYGLTVMGSLLQNGSIKRGLLLVGDTPTRASNKEDKSTFPFFGDAGTATLLEYEENAYGLRAELGTIEKDYNKIIMPEGGFRKRPTMESFVVLVDSEKGIRRRPIDTHMDGMDVFSMSTKQDPETIKTLLDKSGIDINQVDIFGFHQTNKFLMDRVVKRLKIEHQKVPSSLSEYANTSGASIPLTLITKNKQQLCNSKVNIVGCALGVGLSYGAVYFESNRIIVPDVIQYQNKYANVNNIKND